MSVQSVSPEGDLFYEDLIHSYVNTPRFVERSWLAERIQSEMNDPSHRFLLLTAEPGAGKTAFMAWLASKHPDWPRYFIRRDQVSPLGPVGTRSLLLQIGFQLVACYPRLFSVKQVEITIRQRLGALGHDAEAIGAEVDSLIASPFMQTALHISQEVGQVRGKLRGLHIREWITDPRLIRDDDLQNLALIGPATTLLRGDPDQRIVILIDALDELRYQDSEGNLLQWLANVSPLPENVCFVLTSRPDDDLLRVLRDKQATYLSDIYLDPAKHDFRTHIEGDMFEYAQRLVQAPRFIEALGLVGHTPADFITTAVAKAEGNLGYLNTIGRAVDQALIQNDATRLLAVARLDDLPPNLENLYAFFLHQIRDQVRDRTVTVEDSKTGEFLQASAWSTVYNRILGTLCVAREYLTSEQIQRFGRIHTSWSDFIEAMDHLRQFFDQESGRYRLYHPTLSEFLTRSTTQTNPETCDLYQEPGIWHRSIMQLYQQSVGGWVGANWELMDDYGWRHLTAHASHAEQVPGANVLFDLCDGGFLLAKRQAMASLAALEEDWYRVLHKCRTSGDFVRFVRYGLQRSLQFTEVAYLQNTRACATATRLAIRLGDTAAIERLVTEIALVSHPLARIRAEETLLNILTEEMPAHPAVNELDRSLSTALASLPPSQDRDHYLADYVAILARRQQAGWQDIGNAYLDQIQDLLPRVSLLATLAQGYASEGKQARAATLIRQALTICLDFNIEEDIVPDILEAVFGEERIAPVQVLAAGLRTILEASLPLSQEDCAEIVATARQHFSRFTDETTRVQLEAIAIHILDNAGLHDEAYAVMHALLVAYLEANDAKKSIHTDAEPVPEWAADAFAFFGSSTSAGQIVALLTLLPAVVLIGNETDMDQWHRCVADHLKLVSSASDLLSVSRVVADLAEQANLAPVLHSVIRQFGNRTHEIPTGEVSFAIAATLAVAYARVGEEAHARHLLTQIFDQVSALSLGPSEYPEQAQGRASGMFRAWETACLVSEPDLVQKTLDWLVEIVTDTLPRDSRADLWVDVITTLECVSDIKLANEVFGRLKLLMVEVMDTGGYFATACWQLADAYVGLHLPREARRLLTESIQVAQEALDSEWLVRHLVRTIHLYVHLNDQDTSIDLLNQALSLIPTIEGDNIKADILRSVLSALDVLVTCQKTGRELAVRLLEEVRRIAETIELEEYVVSVLTAIIQFSTQHDLPGPTRELTRAARLYLQSSENNRLRTVIQAVLALHRAQNQQAVQASRKLLRELEDTIMHLPHRADNERAAVCQACADLVTFYYTLDEPSQAQKWHDLAARLSQRTKEPEWRTDTCIAMVQIEAQVGLAHDAGVWLSGAITSWHGIGEWLYASSRISDIFNAWSVIPDDEERRSHIDAMRSVIWRVPDLNQRDSLLARLALPFLHMPALFKELAEAVTSQDGIDTLLTGVHNAEVVSEEILPEELYNLLEKSSRKPRGFFAGNALLATQIAVHHDVFTSDTTIPALKILEQIIREIAKRSSNMVNKAG